MELNALICQHWKVLIPKENLFRWGKLERNKEKTLLRAYHLGRFGKALISQQ